MSKRLISSRLLWSRCAALVLVLATGCHTPIGADRTSGRRAYNQLTASALSVRSGHSCQEKPLAIEEVRRILLEHLDVDPAVEPASQ